MTVLNDFNPFNETWRIALAVQRYLRRHFDVVDDHPNFEGLCDVASSEIVRRIEALHIPDFYAEAVHGELAHKPTIESKYWPLQHTIAKVHFGKKTFYVDPTVAQFKGVIHVDDISMEKLYISDKKPPYMYLDRDNPAWNGITRDINNRFKLRRTITSENGEPHVIHDGIVEFIQYEIWGRISDHIHHRIHG